MRNTNLSLTRSGAVTAKDIGRQLGLSQSTVSRILSNAPGHRVSAETRQRVLDTAASLGYRPNAVARSLRRRRTNIVGFYTGYGSLDSRNAFLAEVIGGLLSAANSYRLDLLLHGVFRGASTDDIFSELMDGRIDGLFVHTYAEDPLVARLQNSSLPVVAIADPIPGIPSVVCDDADGVRQLVAYLWERGHRNIAYLHPRLHLTSVEIRRQTFMEEMAARQVPPELSPVFIIDVENAGPALEAMRQLPIPPTAVCCWNDLTALDMVVACRERGLSIPDDVAIVGFDGLLDPKRTIRSPVTIGANWQRITHEAMALMVRQIEIRTQRSDETVEVASLTCLPVTLIAGDTV
jgi:DNA-binding LacI/PurR family transcriptional regulator